MQRPRTFAAAGLIMALLTGLAQAADQYEIDVSHTTVGFSVRHMVITNVKGKFNDFSGRIFYDENDISKSSVQVTIKAASIDTSNARRDEHLRSPDFFETAKHPEITFRSEKIEKRGDGYVAHGPLTMRGVSRPVSIPFAITGKVKDPGGKERIGVEASLTINRQDWGIAWSRVMDNGGLVVSNEVKIELNVQAIKS